MFNKFAKKYPNTPPKAAPEEYIIRSNWFDTDIFFTLPLHT
jgi:hypothetical protein